MTRPLVSVLMPAYNAEEFIKKSIQSILNQSYHYFELLIVDDCSNDDTYKLINEFNDPRIVILKNNKNLGYLKSCNKLFEICKGDYITFQDADDWSHQFRIEKLLNVMLENSNLGLCASRHSIVINNTSSDSVEISSPLNFLRREIPFNFPCLGSSVMISKRALNDIGGYHPFFDRLGGEDLEWISRVVDHFDSFVIDSVLYFYRYSTHSITNKNYKLASIIMNEMLRYGILKRRTSGINPFDEFLNKEISWIINEMGLSNSRISELYRIRAAHDLDKKKVKEAYECLKESFRYKVFSVRNFQTLFYLIRVWFTCEFTRITS